MQNVLAIGNFDGVHLGHRALFEAARGMARSLGAATLAVTFTPHPLELMGREVSLLSSDREKEELILGTGLIDRVCFLPFTEELRELRPEEFFRDVLVGRLGACGIAVGENFRFGVRGSGTPADMARFCAEAGIAFRAVPLLLDGGEPVSSSRIRELLEAGLREEAERLAGHPLPDPGQDAPETI